MIRGFYNDNIGISSIQVKRLIEEAVSAVVRMAKHRQNLYSCHSYNMPYATFLLRSHKYTSIFLSDLLRSQLININL